MTHESRPGIEAVLAAFLDRLATDRRTGEARSLAAYQALFPGYESEIADEYDLATGRGEERPAPAWLPGEGSLERIGPGDRFARYDIRRELGRGGQGIVFLADDTRDGRRVALKVLSGLGQLSRAAILRFRREARLAGRLDHPGICTPLDSGVHAGVPFLAMPFLEGETLAQKIARWRDGSEPRPPHERLVGCAIEIADALHAAHEQGVLHRDVKPGNIMITPEGRSVVLDFGIARDLDGGEETITGSATRVGTPAYMAPEQLAAEGSPPDRRTDVFSLGVVLFEALTLRRPFREQTVAGIRKEVHFPPPPDPCKLEPSVSGDLAAVLETALAADRRDRFLTARHFADELRRIQSATPVRVRRAGSARRLRRWARRNPVVAGFTLGLFFLLTVSMIVFAALFITAQHARRDSERQQYYAGITAASQFIEEGETEEARRLLAETPEGLRGWEHGYLLAQTDTSVFTWKPTTGSIVGLVVAPDGEQALVLAGDGSAIAGTLGEGEGRVGAAHRVPGEPYAAASSPDARWIVGLARIEGRSNIRVWGVSDPRPKWERTWSGNRLLCPCVGPGGVHVFWGKRPRTVMHWNTTTGQVDVFAELPPGFGGVMHLAVDPSGRSLLVAGLRLFGPRWSLRTFDIATGRLLVEMEQPTGNLEAVAFSHDGRRIVTAGSEAGDEAPGGLRIWDLARPRCLAAYQGGLEKVTALAVAPDDSRVFVGFATGKVRIWDGGLQEALDVLTGHSRPVTGLAFDANRQRLFAASGRGEVKAWTVSEPQGLRVIPVDELGLSSVAFDSNGERLAWGGNYDWLEIWNLAADDLEAAFRTPFHSEVEFAADGRAVLFWGARSTCPPGRFDLDRRSCRLLVDEAAAEKIGHVAIDAAGERMIVADRDGRDLRILSARDGRALAALTTPGDPLIWLTFAGDGRRLAAISEVRAERPEDRLRHAWVWRRLDARPIEVLSAEARPDRLALSPQGSRVAVACREHVLEILDLDSNRPLPRRRVFDQRIGALDFSPDGRRLAVAAKGTVSILDAESGRRLLDLRSLPRSVTCLRFGPKGRYLAAACLTGDVVVWEAGRTSPKAPRVARERSTERVRARVRKLIESGTDLRSALFNLGPKVEVSDGSPKEQAALPLLRWTLAGFAGPSDEIASHSLLSHSGCPRRWYEMALEDVRAQAISFPEDSNLGVREGRALYRLGRLEEAEAVLEQAIEKSMQRFGPGGGDLARKFLAVCRWVTRGPEAARALHRKVDAERAKETSGTPPAEWFDYFAELCALDDGAGLAAYEEALSWAKTAWRLQPNPGFRVTQAALLCRLGRFREALALLDRARSSFATGVSKRHAVVAAVSCLCNHALGRDEEAESEFNRLLVLRHTTELARDRHVIRLLGEVCSMLGR